MSQTQTKQYDFTLEEVQKLFAMQDTLNSYIHPEWKTQGFNWGLAIVDECMEIHGHLGWKWWKKDYQVGLTEANRKQIQLEVIDILHFVVSSWIEEEAPYITYFLQDINAESFPMMDLESQVLRLQGVASYSRDDQYMEHFVDLCHAVGLTKSQILETYTQKYVLNKFRQDHGYKTGEYCKEWHIDPEDGRKLCRCEDNWWLERVVDDLQLMSLPTTDEDVLYSRLKDLYNRRLNQ